MDAWLEVLEAAGPAMVQDGGRAGLMHHGVPPGGALVPEWLAAANRSVGNVWSAAALECYGRLELRLHGRDAWVSVDGRASRVEAGGQFSVPAPEAGVVRYVAVEGAFDVPEVLGGRGTLPVARLGGVEGRVLKRGDVLPLGAGGGSREELSVALPLDAEVRVVLGPDLGRFGADAVEVLLESAFSVSPTSDRVGMRLRGPALPHADEGSGLSGPMVRGALQVPASGEVIVLGPDHPTTGGYPVLAVVIRADWGSLFARRPGAAVRFRAVSVDEAREFWRQHAPVYGAAPNPSS
ncbi:biotin-dependent carboxyltransferase family protein [Archangium lansingense]|uniref:Biotin-dependent carboxyltransferase family protein n=1 Tax=Archangium lansingense TaxID=2995310 RepID=A0ABT4AN25_9BACT|nr:biotin-dependent carboxyltransferase family protein [Archangium lansinium]MCY1083083.1 biotin-dependent carboxyltransferase family protein [Archangium lansinium]